MLVRTAKGGEIRQRIVAAEAFLLHNSNWLDVQNWAMPCNQDVL